MTTTIFSYSNFNIIRIVPIKIHRIVYQSGTVNINREILNEIS